MRYTYTDLAHDFWPYAFLILGIVVLLSPGKSSGFRTVAYTVLGWLIVLVAMPQLIGDLGSFLFFGLALLCFVLMRKARRPVSEIYVIGAAIFAIIGIIAVPDSPEFQAVLSTLLIY